MSNDLTNEMTLEKAKLWQQEAISTYEKALSRYLVQALERETKLREELESVANCDYLGEGGCAKALLKELYSCEYRDNDAKP